MLKTIKTLRVSDDTFQSQNGPLHHVNVEFTDGLVAYCNCTQNPPWYKVGDEVEVVMKGSKTKGENPVDKISIKKPDQRGGGGGYKGGGKGGGGGARGGNESFALSYSKDIVVALIAKDKITSMDDALAEVEKGFHKLLPLLAPVAQKPAEDPKWLEVLKVIQSEHIEADIKKLEWKKSKCIEEFESAGKNASAFAGNVKRMANPPPQDADVPADFDEYEDDIPF